MTALALRFVNKLRKKTNQHGPLDANEMELAEILWTKYVQRQQYSEVVNSIMKSKSNNLTVMEYLGVMADWKMLNFVKMQNTQFSCRMVMYIQTY